MKRILFVNILILLVFASVSYWAEEKEALEAAVAEDTQSVKENGQEIQKTREKSQPEQEAGKDFIRWVDFGVSKFAMTEAYEYDRDTYGTDVHIGWIDLLAWTAAHTGGSFENDRTVCQYMESLEEKVSQGEEISKLAKDLQYFSYYQEAYSAVLGGMVGEYEIEEPVEGEDGKKAWVKKYGLKAFNPIAKGFPYSDYDDFGVSRSYGYKRNHLGHDMMGQIGTPIIILTRVRLESNV